MTTDELAVLEAAEKKATPGGEGGAAARQKTR